MTSKSDFTSEEWQLVLEAPPSAGMIVVTAQRGGSFRETIAMAKAYVEARQQHGESELLDEIVAAKPERDHTHYHSPEELKDHGLQHLRDAVALLERKAAPAEVDEYRRSSSRWPTRSQLPTESTVRRSATPSRRRSTTSRRLWAQPRGRRRGAPRFATSTLVRVRRNARVGPHSDPVAPAALGLRTGRHRRAAGARMRSPVPLHVDTPKLTVTRRA